jgi:hypothetical protein
MAVVPHSFSPPSETSSISITTANTITATTTTNSTSSSSNNSTFHPLTFDSNEFKSTTKNQDKDRATPTASSSKKDETKSSKKEEIKTLSSSAKVIQNSRHSLDEINFNSFVAATGASNQLTSSSPPTASSPLAVASSSSSNSSYEYLVLENVNEIFSISKELKKRFDQTPGDAPSKMIGKIFSDLVRNNNATP